VISTTGPELVEYPRVSRAEGRTLEYTEAIVTPHEGSTMNPWSSEMRIKRYNRSAGHVSR